MTDRVALVFGLVIILAIGVDYVFADFAYSLFLAKKLAELTEYIAFWR